MANLEVKVIRKKGHAAVIEAEFEDGSAWVIVPTSAVEIVGDVAYVSEEQLELAIPYGIPWSSLLSNFTVRGEVIAKELEKMGVRTKEDVASKPNEVRGALFATIAPVLRQITAIARDYGAKEN
jgi:hypothetical protein